MLRCRIAPLPLVHLKMAEVAIVTVSPDPHFYPSLYRFLWNVLFEGCPALAFDHGLISGAFTVRVVTLPAEDPTAVVNEKH